MTDQEFFNRLNWKEKELAQFWLHGGSNLLHIMDRVLEIGSGWGIFARIAKIANPGSRYLTIDKRVLLPEFDENTAGIKNIEKLTGESKDYLPKIEDKGYGLVFIDGSHNYKDVAFDLEHALRIAKFAIVVDDVFHEHNFDGDYGVLRALAEWSFAHKLKIQIVPVANGIAIISLT